MKQRLAFPALLFPVGCALGGFKSDITPFLQKHCIQCHGPEKQKGRIRYDKLSGYEASNNHLWTLVHQQLADGEMPPEEEPRPKPAEIQKVLTWIEKQQLAAKSGKTRRLNRRELAASLQDLTGLGVDYAYMLPEDGKVNGFDTGADGLHDAADSVARVMEVTRMAVDALRFLDPDQSQTFTADLDNSKNPSKEFDKWKARGGYGKLRRTMKEIGAYIEPRWLGDRGGQEFGFQMEHKDKKGVIRTSATVSLYKNKWPEMPDPILWTRFSGRTLGYYPIGNPLGSPRTITFDAQMDEAPLDKKKGLKVTLVNRVEFPYGVKGFANDEKAKPEDKVPGGTTGLYRPYWDKKKQKLRAEETPYPYIILHNVEFKVGFQTQWPPDSWEANLGGLTDNDESATKLLGVWMERAWRRPVNVDEQKPFLDFYKKLRSQKDMGFDDALRATFQSVLMSGPFRYIGSPSQTKHPQHALATRLSFLLNGTPPDAQLRKLADEGSLKDSKVVDKEIDRLLANSRALTHFWTPFVTQWLEMGQPITLVMDHIKKQDFKFGRNLKESMRQETIQYVQTLFNENRPARELIRSNWTMMNNILARHYGYEGVQGGELRKVKLRKDDPRGGGILSHAGIQSMLTWMGDNWVIYRGAWALRHILDDPPPPPPLEVPELDPTEGKNRGKPFRELLQQHQNDEKCSVCHKYMDPLGFAFQNFDISGRWRDLEHETYKRDELDGKIAWRPSGKSRPVDSVGTLPRGESFKTYDEMKKLLVSNYIKDVTGGVFKNIILYGTGRTADVDDLATIEKILAKNQGLKLKDTLKALLNSESFTKH